VITVRDILGVMEEIAPEDLAETWDNPGLHVGDPEWAVKRVCVALDPTFEVIEEAAADQVDLVITHHPLIFGPLYSLDLGSGLGKRIETAVKARVAVMCAHTNLDSARGGVNDMLAEKLGLQSVEVLRAVEDTRYKAVIYVPKGHEQKLLEALFASGLGEGKRYSCLSFRTEGTGTFLPGETADPFLNPPKGELAQVDEYRIEIELGKNDLSALREVLNQTHPYEEVIWDLYPLPGRKGANGLGRVGDLSEPGSFSAIVETVKTVFGLSVVKTAGNPRQLIQRVAVCSGSGRSLVGDFLSSDADVMISGDMGYHDGQRVADAGKALIDIGHFCSEHIMVEGLSQRLSECLKSRGWDVAVVPFSLERDCFQYL